MSENAEWDPLHWLKAKELSMERKAAAAAAASAQPGDAFLIVTEGTVTEPVYFELLLGALELSRVWVRVMPGDHSDPRHVIRTADRIALEQQRKAEKKLLGIGEPEDFDHVWAVIDTDVAVRDGIWNDVKQLAAARAVTLAHSTPCFEFWLLLHLVEHATTRGDLQNGDAAKAAVKRELGRDYSTNEETAREAIGSFIGSWPRAVVHAELVRRQHETAATPAPANPSTEVDRLIRALNDSAPEHLRRL
jgi:hypothetical protein